MAIPDFVNALPPSERLGVLRNYFREEDLGAPIDMYLATIAQILAYGTVAKLAECDFLGRLLALGVISAAEAYFRGVMAACMEICPVCRRTASENSKQINLGGLLWHGKDGYSRSAFEHHAFASKDEVVKALSTFLGIRLSDASFKSLLDEYDSACHLRHGIVHCDGLLPGRNAVVLDVPRFARPARIVIRYEQLQSIAAVVGNLVLVTNREIFAVMVRRWAGEWRNRADWVPLEGEALFEQIWNIFYSRQEHVADDQARADKFTACRQEAATQYGV